MGTDLCSDEDFKAALSRWCTGVTVVTAQHEGVRHGMTVSAFSSVSRTPPCILVCLKSSGRTAGLIEQSGVFAVNILGAGQDEISNRFAGRDTELDRFADIAHRPGLADVPLLAEALAVLETRVVSRVSHGDHTVFFAHVRRVHTIDTDPLLYFRGDYQAIVYGRRKAPRS